MPKFNGCPSMRTLICGIDSFILIICKSGRYSVMYVSCEIGCSSRLQKPVFIIVLFSIGISSHPCPIFCPPLVKGFIKHSLSGCSKNHLISCSRFIFIFYLVYLIFHLHCVSFFVHVQFLCQSYNPHFGLRLTKQAYRQLASSFL